jgi:glycosyltransferase 2 family protein
MKRYGWLIRLIGPALLLIFLASADREEMLSVLAGARPWPIVLSLLLMPPFILIKAWRWKLILRELGLYIALWPAALLYTIGLYLATVTPGQAGDLVKAWYLRDQGQPLGAALFSIVLDRLFDLLVMGLVAACGIFAFWNLLPNRGAQGVAAALLVGGVVVALVLFAARGPREWLFARATPLLPRRLSGLVEGLREQISQLHLRPGALALLILASLLSAFFTFYRVYLLFVSIGVVVPLLAFVAMTAMVALVQVLPSIAGIGTRDALLIALLALYGYSAEQALSLSALLLLLNIEHILVGFLLSLRYPIGSKALSSET